MCLVVKPPINHGFKHAKTTSLKTAYSKLRSQIWSADPASKIPRLFAFSQGIMNGITRRRWKSWDSCDGFFLLVRFQHVSIGFFKIENWKSWDCSDNFCSLPNQGILNPNMDINIWTIWACPNVTKPYSMHSWNLKPATTGRRCQTLPICTTHFTGGIGMSTSMACMAGIYSWMKYQMMNFTVFQCISFCDGIRLGTPKLPKQATSIWVNIGM